uniref:DH domain-containing protein n=1 Tax=Heterorhabditis bacteriophora TaxID=37862 RepID=A0A1I7WJ23_HETBA
MDKNSIVRLKYKSNLDQAIKNTDEQVNLEDIERFWRYRYKLPPKEKNNIVEEKEHEDNKLSKIRSHTPTIERVVLYYTTDKRPLTPSLSSAAASLGSPSPEPPSRSPSFLSAYPASYLFKQPIKEEKISTSASDSFSTSHGSREKTIESENTNENEIETCISNYENTTDQNDIVQSNEVEAMGIEIKDFADNISFSETSAYFRLDKMSESDSEEGRVGLDGNENKGFKKSDRIKCFRVGSDIDSSSMEDLLAIDTRPSSSGRKSVTFSEFIDIEIMSPDFLRKVRPNSSFRSMKPILKKEDKQRETMRRLLEYVAERLYKDLRMLVEERDRIVYGITITPKQTQQLSVQSSIYQSRYRDKLVENKTILDKKIEFDCSDVLLGGFSRFCFRRCDLLFNEFGFDRIVCWCWKYSFILCIPNTHHVHNPFRKNKKQRTATISRSTICCRDRKSCIYEQQKTTRNITSTSTEASGACSSLGTLSTGAWVVSKIAASSQTASEGISVASEDVASGTVCSAPGVSTEDSEGTASGELISEEEISDGTASGVPIGADSATGSSDGTAARVSIGADSATGSSDGTAARVSIGADSSTGSSDGTSAGVSIGADSATGSSDGTTAGVSIGADSATGSSDGAVLVIGASVEASVGATSGMWDPPIGRSY